MALSERTRIEREHVAITTDQRSCEVHGAFTATLWELQPTIPGGPACLAAFWSRCPTCDGEQQKLVDAHDAEILGGLTEKQRLAGMRLREAGIPQRFAEASLWNYQHAMDGQRRVWHWARDYAQAFELALSTGRCGVFLGAPGTGKTHLAIGLLRHIVEKGGTGCYTTVMGMLGRIKGTYGRDASETEAQAIEAFTRPDLLVVDEVGRQVDTAYEHAQLFSILNTRYNALKPVILIANLNKGKLIEFLGDAVVDRMREAGGALHVFDWASARSSKAVEAPKP